MVWWLLGIVLAAPCSPAVAEDLHMQRVERENVELRQRIASLKAELEVCQLARARAVAKADSFASFASPNNPGI